MDLIGWSLNAIVQNFSTRKPGIGEPACPGGTFSARFTMDSWAKWRPLCLAVLSVEDVEDVYIIGIMITGFLLFGAGGLLFYRKARKAMAAYSAIEKLPVIEGLCRAINGQTQVTCDLKRQMDTLMGKMDTMLGMMDRAKGAPGIRPEFD